MQIGEYQFTQVGSIEPEHLEDGSVKPFHPQARFNNERGIALHNYGAGPFCKFRIARGIKAAGIYIVTQDEAPVYVGQAINLDKRWSSNGYGGISPRNCFHGGQQTNCRLNNLIFEAKINGRDLTLWFHETANDKTVLDSIERHVMALAQPIWNKAGMA